MAEKTQNNESSSKNKIYLISAIVLFISIAYSMFLGFRLYSQLTTTYNTVQDSLVSLSTVNDELLVVNRDMLMMISGTGNKDDLWNDIDNSFKKIDKNMKDYESIEDRDEKELKRYTMAKTFIKGYNNKIDKYKAAYDETGAIPDANTYIQELHPLQVTASEMFTAAKDLGQTNSEKQLESVNRLLIVFEVLLFALFIIGEVAIIIIAKVSNKREQELARRQADLAEFESKLKLSKRQVTELSTVNTLTGLKNRYQLEADITDKLISDNMCIALLNVDKFAGINDIYGYAFGDEYLVAIAERLKADLGDKCDIYNTQGNEFCLVFPKGTSVNQGKQLTVQALDILSDRYVVTNLSMQLTATGCFCDYAAGTCDSVSSLLLRMTPVIRSAKDNGGNTIKTI